MNMHFRRRGHRVGAGESPIFDVDKIYTSLNRIELHSSCNFEMASAVVITPAHAKSNPFKPASCCFLFALPHASDMSHVSYPRLNSDRAVVSQQQSVMTPQTTTRSISCFSKIARSLLGSNVSPSVASYLRSILAIHRLLH